MSKTLSGYNCVFTGVGSDLRMMQVQSQLIGGQEGLPYIIGLIGSNSYNNNDGDGGSSSNENNNCLGDEGGLSTQECVLLQVDGCKKTLHIKRDCERERGDVTMIEGHGEN